MDRIVMFSGGVGSWMTAKRVAAAHGVDGLTLLFSDTLMEDEDLYRFLDAAAADVGGELVKVTEGRTPWEVFKDVRFLGNTRIDPCSRVLKREILRKWLNDNCQPESTIIYIGIDWTEGHRFERAVPFWKPWTIESPLMDAPYLSKQDMIDNLLAAKIATPRLYDMGFPHNNCGGFCIKAGQAHFKLLLDKMPERYAFHEQQEQELREYLGKDVAILRDRRGGQTKPMTLRIFRERQGQGELFDKDEWGGCACFAP